MAGPRMARMVGAGAALLGALLLVIAARDGAQLATNDASRWLVFVPAVIAAACWCVRLALWSAVMAPADVSVPDADSRDIAERAHRTTEIAVICDGESLVLVRTSVIAAIASTGSAARVSLVGADPRLDGLARSLGVRRVPSAIGPDAAIAAAVAAADGTHLALVPASTAILPGALRPALERLDDGSMWVQCDPIPGVDRLLADHLDHERWWPSLDRRRSMPWFGLCSIVVVESFRSLPLIRGAAATTVAAQARGWHGRWQRSPIAVEQTDGRRSPDREIEARAARLRQFRTRSSPLFARHLTARQRLAHVAQLVDDLAGLAALAGIAAVVAALITGHLPTSGSWTSWGLVAVAVTGWLARLLLTGGLVRPGGWLRSSMDDLVPSVAAVVRSMRRGRRTVVAPVIDHDAHQRAASRRTRWGAGPALLALVLVVDVALAWRAVSLVRQLADGAPADVATAALLFAAGTVTMVALLASARVVRRNRTLRSSRRLPTEIVARIGTWEGRVLDLGAGGLRVEFAAPAELLAELPIQLIARGVRPIEARVQVVRVDARLATWVLGLRLAGGGLAGEHDDYLALWLSQMSGAAEERPRAQPDPAVGRAPVRSGGAPVLRVASAMVMVSVGLAVFPPVHRSLASTEETVAAASMESTPTERSQSLDDATIDDATIDDATIDDATIDDATIDDATGIVDRPMASVGGLELTTSVDDTDRIVGGGQRVAHTARLRTTGAGAVTSVELVVDPAIGAIDPTSISGTCAGGDIAESGVAGAIRWALFDESAQLGIGDDCTVSWTLIVPPARELRDGAVLTTVVRVETLVVEAGVEAGVEAEDEAGVEAEVGTRAGPSVEDLLVAARPTLRITAGAGGGAEIGQMAIGTPFTWVLTVSNESAREVTAYGVDLVHTLPPNWVYTSTVSVSPIACDVSPIVLVDDTTSIQTITWTDMCDVPRGSDVVLVFTATPQAAAATSPGLVGANGARAQHVSSVEFSAEDAGGTSLGSASDRAAAVARSVDLAVRLTDVGPDDGPADPVSADPGMVVGTLSRYRIDVANEGPDRTTSPITVALTLPEGIVVIDASGEGWTCTIADSVSCVRNLAIGPGDTSSPIVATVAVAEGAVGDSDSSVVTAAAAVSTSDLDRDATDDLDEETSPVRRPELLAERAEAAVTGPAMMLVAFTADRQVSVGEAIEYEVIISNQGPVAHTGGVTVEATMPPGLSLDDVAGPGWECEIGRSGGGGTGGWSCELAGADGGVDPDPIAPGAVLGAIVVRAVVTPAAVRDETPGSGEPFWHVVALAAAAPEERVQSQLSWVAAPRTTGVVTIDVADELSGGWRVQEQRPVQVTVSTTGPNGEYGPVVVELPIGDIALDQVEGEGWACSRRLPTDADADADANGVVRCEYGRRGLDPGEVLIAPGGALPPIEMTAVATVDGEVEQLVRSQGATDDTVRTAVLSADVERRVGLALAVEAPERVTVGDEIEVRWTVSNDGPSSTSGGRAVSGALPDGWTLADATTPGWVCGAADETVTCRNEERIVPGAGSTITLVLAVGDGASLGATTFTSSLVADAIDAIGGVVEATNDDDVVDVSVWVRPAPATEPAASSEPALSSAPTVDAEPAVDADPTVDAEARLLPGQGQRLPVVAGYSGAIGAFALALLLISGRRRRGW